LTVAKTVFNRASKGENRIVLSVHGVQFDRVRYWDGPNGVLDGGKEEKDLRENKKNIIVKWGGRSLTFFQKSAFAELYSFSGQ